MLGSLLKGTAWSELGSYLSPAFFDVVSPLEALMRVRSLVDGYATRRGFPEAEAAALALLPRLTKAARGDMLLELYFRQIASTPTAVLDFRLSQFEHSDDRLTWSPSPLFVSWKPPFIASLRDLYAGFYGDDDALYEDALDRMGLLSGKAVLTQHFGADQHAVTFHLADFRKTFHEIFQAAKKSGARLDPDLLGFGCGLVCLYEHLEGLGGAFDVKAAYLRAQR